MEIQEDGRVLDHLNGQQLGYIKDDIAYSGDLWTSGRQVGYLKADSMYAGGYGTDGGKRVGPCADAHPRSHAAASFLLT
jgi:hypothetical protein